ncbi:MAG TPA: hypothetical protein P5186_27485 [Candidatus Paceibacterota bacterium]|nr:hypothetical protein [Verrucomicrobiota bacterium]HRY51797.1 hypothetical protein [Candidatus Paceibacterota bacterium]
MRCLTTSNLALLCVGLWFSGCSTPAPQTSRDTLPPEARRGYVEFSGDRADHRLIVYEIDSRGKRQRLGIVSGPTEVGEPAIYVAGPGSERLRVALAPGRHRFTTDNVNLKKDPPDKILELEVKEGWVTPVKIFHALLGTSNFRSQYRIIYTVGNPFPAH